MEVARVLGCQIHHTAVRYDTSLLYDEAGSNLRTKEACRIASIEPWSKRIRSEYKYSGMQVSKLKIYNSYLGFLTVHSQQRLQVHRMKPTTPAFRP